MGAKSRRKGAAFEYDVKKFLQGREWHVVRHYQRIANNDAPDLTCTFTPATGAYRIVKVECKNRASMPAKCDSDALDQALASAGPGVAVACVKRPGSATGESMVLMRLDDFVKLVEQ